MTTEPIFLFLSLSFIKFRELGYELSLKPRIRSDLGNLNIVMNAIEFLRMVILEILLLELSCVILWQ